MYNDAKFVQAFPDVNIQGNRNRRHRNMLLLHGAATLGAAALGGAGALYEYYRKPVNPVPRKNIKMAKTIYYSPQVSKSGLTYLRQKSAQMKAKLLKAKRSKNKVSIVPMTGLSTIAAPKKKLLYNINPGVAAGVNKFARLRRKKLKVKRYVASHSKTVEASGSIGSVYASHLVHGTHPVEQVLRLFVEALVRMTVTRLGIAFSNFFDTAGVNGGWAYVYYASLGTTTLTTRSGTFLSTDSFDTICNSIFTDMLSQMQLDGTRDIKFETFTINREAPYTQQSTCRLSDFYVAVQAKSSYKMQNRSRNALGSEADEVDNVPIHGKIYGLKGTGSIFRDLNRFANCHPVIDRLTGLRAINGDTDGTQALREVVDGVDIVGNPKPRKITVNPGEIKTSVLKWTVKMNLDQLSKHVLEAKNSNYPRVMLGRSRLISVEKMIGTNEVGETAMSIFYELNIDFTVSYRYKPYYRPIKTLIRYGAVN